MYSATFYADNGNAFYFGYEHSTIFDIDPLSGIPVEISTSQGYQQVGQTVEAQTVEGISREVRGVITGEAITVQKQMQNTFRASTKGKLYFNDRYYCDCVVERTPTFQKSASGKISFSLMLFCAYPYWSDAGETVATLGGYTPAFSFPVCYDSHTFGIRDENAYTELVNSGEAECNYVATFWCSGSVTGYGFEEVNTLSFLRLNDTLTQGETVTVSRTGGLVTAVKRYANGREESIFSRVDEDSTFLSVPEGTSVVKALPSGNPNLYCSIAFSIVHGGVFDGM